VLTGRRTGVMALHSLLGQVPLTIVGEPPGSGLNHYGDATSRTYPRTGLRLRVSTLWWQLGASDDIREYLPVDVAAPFSSADYANGRDPAVDPILRGEEMRSISMIAISASGADARRALEERRKRFSRYPWWSPPAESDLRQTCQELRAKKRYGDALDVCALNAELHPYDWSSWLNLGQAQRATGLAAGLGSYRCVLLVDPSNPEADGIKAFLKTHDPDNAVALPTGCPYR
jgi:hypothetical protein